MPSSVFRGRGRERQAGLPEAEDKRGWGLPPLTASISCSEVRGEVTAERGGGKEDEGDEGEE